MDNVIFLEDGRWIKEEELLLMRELEEKMRPKIERLRQAARQIEDFNRYMMEEEEKIANGDVGAINRRYLNRFNGRKRRNR